MTTNKVDRAKLEEGILPDIFNLNLDMIKMKIMDKDEGAGWNIETCNIAELQYKRFLTLNKLYPEKSIVPDKIIDTVWHYHILDTRKYHLDSDKIFGSYFHHFPYFGLRSETDKKNLINSFEETKQLFQQHFKIDLVAESSHCDSGDTSTCRNCVSSYNGN